jgi:hypothetical protein
MRYHASGLGVCDGLGEKIAGDPGHGCDRAADLQHDPPAAHGLPAEHGALVGAHDQLDVMLKQVAGAGNAATAQPRQLGHHRQPGIVPRLACAGDPQQAARLAEGLDDDEVGMGFARVALGRCASGHDCARAQSGPPAGRNRGPRRGRCQQQR